MIHPAALWVRFEMHCDECPACRQAGGTRAPREMLCRRGRAILDAWEDAELAWARIRSQHAGHTDEELYAAMKHIGFPGGVERGV